MLVDLVVWLSFIGHIIGAWGAKFGMGVALGLDQVKAIVAWSNRPLFRGGDMSQKGPLTVLG